MPRNRVEEKQIKTVHEVNELKEEIKLLKVNTESLKKQLETETEIIDKKLKGSTDEIITTVHNLLESKLSGEVQKNVVEFRDIMKQPVSYTHLTLPTNREV